MTPTTPEPIDRILSDFFKSELKNPWPAAPDTASLGTASLGTASPGTALPGNPRFGTPRPLASSPAASAQVVLTAPAGPPLTDPTAKARYTLAASVALLLGTCWYFSSGLPGRSTGPFSPNTTTPDLLPDLTAGDPAALKHLRKDKAEHDIAPPMTGFKFD